MIGQLQFRAVHSIMERGTQMHAAPPQVGCEPGVTDAARCPNGSLAQFFQVLVLEFSLPLAFPVYL